MSYIWIERKNSATIRITDLRCLVSAMESNLGIKLLNSTDTVKRVRQAERNLEEATIKFEKSSVMSLKDVQAMELAIHEVMSCSADLHEAMKQLKNEGLPSQLRFEHSGQQYSLDWKAGGFVLNWTEKVEVESSTGGESGRRRGGESQRKFVRKLRNAYENSVNYSRNEEKMWAERINNLNSDMGEQLERAIRIRTRWEAVEEKRRIENLKTETRDLVMDRIENMGWNVTATEIEKEIIIQGELFTDSGSTGTQDHWGKSSW